MKNVQVRITGSFAMSDVGLILTGQFLTERISRGKMLLFHNDQEEITFEIAGMEMLQVKDNELLMRILKSDQISFLIRGEAPELELLKTLEGKIVTLIGE